jgi:twitching motility protein PilT
MNIFNIFDYLIEKVGSDIHIIPGIPPSIRVDGNLEFVPEIPALSVDQAKTLIAPLMNEEQKQNFVKKKEIDFGFQYQNKGRFRINVYTTKGGVGACMRLIPARVMSIEELGLPPIFSEFTNFSQGLVLVTGPTGEGKSTTLAALVDRINATRAEHILTIEDPIEFVYTPKSSIISQRELNQDTKNWPIALRSALREDPDVVLVGEMRDFETISSTLTVAETGHLVFATLHTSTAAETIDRIIDAFPANQQNQVRQQLAASLKAVVSQRLCSRIGGGRVPAFEIMMLNSAIRNLIREGKTHQIDNVLQTTANLGNVLIETYLVDLVKKNLITTETAFMNCFRKDVLERILGSY